VSYLRKAIASLLKIPDSPERTAFAYAVGVFLGFSPFLGLHTILAVTVSLLFRLNKIAVMLGVWSNVPWLIVPFYAFSAWVGVELLGLPGGISLPDVGFTELFQVEFWRWLSSQWRLLIPTFFGSLLLSVLLALLAYPAALLLITKYREVARDKKAELGTDTSDKPRSSSH
jgi:uncharacterized protein (TIGR03546 family)